MRSCCCSLETSVVIVGILQVSKSLVFRSSCLFWKRHPFGKMPLVNGHIFGISSTCLFSVPAVKELGKVWPPLLTPRFSSCPIDIAFPISQESWQAEAAPETRFLIDLVYEIIALVQKPQLVGCSNNCQTASVLAEILWSTRLIVGLRKNLAGLIH